MEKLNVVEFRRNYDGETAKSSTVIAATRLPYAWRGENHKCLLVAILPAQKTSSAALRIEKPLKRPRVPPMLEIMSMTVTVAVATISRVVLRSTHTRIRLIWSRRGRGLHLITKCQ